MKIFKATFLFLIIFSTSAFALNLGTLVNNDYVKLSVNESARFKVLFWNIENESYKIQLNVKEAPEDWTIIIEPNNFVLNSTFGKEYFKLPYGNYVKATPVDIIVKPTNRPGKYDIIISAKTILPQNGINFAQERLFKFVVEVENPLYFENSKQQNVILSNQNNYIEKEKPIVKEINIYPIAILIIILISFLIYKYS